MLVGAWATAHIVSQYRKHRWIFRLCSPCSVLGHSCCCPLSGWVSPPQFMDSTYFCTAVPIGFLWGDRRSCKDVPHPHPHPCYWRSIQTWHPAILSSSWTLSSNSLVLGSFVNWYCGEQCRVPTEQMTRSQSRHVRGHWALYQLCFNVYTALPIVLILTQKKSLWTIEARDHKASCFSVKSVLTKNLRSFSQWINGTLM